ncbi:cupin domain-containing protein [Rhizoctonia solani]|uniref:Cupin domain-containing protein n=1 Tax=Rhizoctonia solani TaxID=456999 RepID=A0A8H8NZB6_9AGAM|nr:cupin domain-containing protein [Rhizoctonia solani]QRW21081.1 cupin domain-containing protein [Rhizoctonia solani]
MASVTDTPRYFWFPILSQFIAGLESKFSQLSVSPDDPLLTARATARVYTHRFSVSDVKGPEPRPTWEISWSSLAHFSRDSPPPFDFRKKRKDQPVHPAALMAQLKRRLHSQPKTEETRDDMEVDTSGRVRAVRKSNLRAGVIVARRKRESGGEDADVSSAEIGTASTPYSRNNSALIYWSRRRASSFGEQSTSASLETSSPTISITEAPNTSNSGPLPNARRRRAGRSASTSGLPLPQLDTTDITVRRPSVALSLMKTPFIQDVDMASPMSATPIMRTSTESSMWGPRKFNRSTIHHGPIEEAPKPSSPPPDYASVMHRDDEDGDADDEKTPLRTMPTRRAGSPAPASSLDTVHEEEETLPKSGVDLTDKDDVMSP